MTVECGVCHAQYDDDLRSTRCPHEPNGIYQGKGMEVMCKCGHTWGRHMFSPPHDCCDKECDCKAFILPSEAEYVSPYFHGKAPVVNMPPSFFEGVDRVDWYHKAGDQYTPACPSFDAETAKMVNDASKRLMATPNFWNAPSSAGDITLEKLQKAYGSAMFGGQPIYVNPYIPKNELWMVSSKGDIHKIINIGNHPTPISDEDEPSLCRGEMK